MGKRLTEAHRRLERGRCREKQRPNPWRVKWSGLFWARWTFQKVLLHVSPASPNCSGKRRLASLARLRAPAHLCQSMWVVPVALCGVNILAQARSRVSEGPGYFSEMVSPLVSIFISPETRVFIPGSTPKKEAASVLGTLGQTSSHGLPFPFYRWNY